jgi:hypothetical protein
VCDCLPQRFSRSGPGHGFSLYLILILAHITHVPRLFQWRLPPILATRGCEGPNHLVAASVRPASDAGGRALYWLDGTIRHLLLLGGGRGSPGVFPAALHVDYNCPTPKIDTEQ